MTPEREAASTGAALILTVVGVYLLLFSFNSLTRTRLFSRDSMTYVDVARNVVEGRGLVQSTLGLSTPSFPTAARFPDPLVQQPPLYPLVVAAVCATTVPCEDAALLVAAAAYGAVLLLTWSLAGLLFDRRSASLVVVLLLVYHPLTGIARHALSETLAIALALGSLLLLARRASYGRTAAAGLLAGLALSARYAMLPLVVAGPAAVLLARRGDASKGLREAALFVAAWGLPTVIVLTRNLLVSSTWAGQRSASDLSLSTILTSIVSALAGSYAGYSARVESAILLVALSAAGLGALMGGRVSLLAARGWLRERGRVLLLLWAGSYLGVLALQRWLYHFDDIGSRLVAPAGLVLVIVIGAACRRHLERVHPCLPAVVAGVVIALAFAREGRLLVTAPPIDHMQALTRSERLQWLSRHTTERDLIIGDDAMYVPFYLRRYAVSFSPYPYSRHPERDQLLALVNDRTARFERHFLVLRDRFQHRDEWERAYGTFIADLMSGHLTGGTFRLRARLRDATVFEIVRDP